MMKSRTFDSLTLKQRTIRKVLLALLAIFFYLMMPYNASANSIFEYGCTQYNNRGYSLAVRGSVAPHGIEVKTLIQYTPCVVEANHIESVAVLINGEEQFPLEQQPFFLNSAVRTQFTGYLSYTKEIESVELQIVYRSSESERVSLTPNESPTLYVNAFVQTVPQDTKKAILYETPDEKGQKVYEVFCGTRLTVYVSHPDGWMAVGFFTDETERYGYIRKEQISFLDENAYHFRSAIPPSLPKGAKMPSLQADSVYQLYELSPRGYVLDCTISQIFEGEWEASLTITYPKAYTVNDDILAFVLYVNGEKKATLDPTDSLCERFYGRFSSPKSINSLVLLPVWGKGGELLEDIHIINCM